LNEVKPEIYFLRYAYPCSHILLKRGEINEKTFELIKKSAIEGKMYITEEDIKRIFWRAFNHLRDISSMEKLKLFWRFEHSKIILEKFSGNLEIARECMVFPCIVTRTKANSLIAKMPFFHETLSLKNELVRDVKKGDRITKHYSHACEKIDEETYERMVEALKKIIR